MEKRVSKTSMRDIFHQDVFQFLKMKILYIANVSVTNSQMNTSVVVKAVSEPSSGVYSEFMIKYSKRASKQISSC